MKKFGKALVILAIIAALSVGILTTAFASEAAEVETSDTDLSLEEAKSTLEAGTPLDQYELPVVVGPLTWEEGSTETKDPKSWGEILGAGQCNDIGVEYEENGNGHFTIRYDGEGESAYEATGASLHTYAYISVADRNRTNDLVMEFDLTTFGDAFPYGMGLEHHSALNDAGGRSQPRFIDIKPDGTLKPSWSGTASKSGYTLTEEEQANLAKYVITKGEWMHFTLIFDAETYFITLYINYEYVCQFDTRPKDVTSYDFTVFRFGSSNGACLDGEVSIDNFIAYEGSYVRTPDLFDNMTEHEKFLFYSDYIRRDDASSGDRIYAYNTMSGMLGDYYVNGSFIPVVDNNMSVEELAALNAKIEAAIDQYNVFVAEEYAELYAGYIRDNLAQFDLLVSELSVMERTLATISDRKNRLAEVDAFLDSVGANILKTEDSGYVEVKKEYDDFVQNLSNDERIVDFCNVMDEFERSLVFSPEAIQKHYDEATAFLNSGIDRAMLGLEGYESFTAAYERYGEAGDILAGKIRDKNAKKIIDCVSFIKEYDTVEEWNENYSYINRYVVIIREVVRENNFNSDAEGITEALAFYNLIDEYFYGLLQQEHAGVLAENLALYVANDGYVEKVGICAYLRAYIAAADIDLEHEDIAPQLLKLDIFESELEQYKADYNDVLVQNTSIFASTVQLISSAATYEERLALYEQARLLYFAMNVGDESIADELAIYDGLTEYFAYVSEVSQSFLLAVDVLRTASGAEEKFAALVECYRYSADAEVGIDGVAEAMEYYLAEHEAYNSAALIANSELDEISVASIGSVRANCGVKEIVAVIVKKVGEE